MHLSTSMDPRSSGDVGSPGGGVTRDGVTEERTASAKESKRAEIVEHAAAVFFEKGYDGSSIQDVAEAVGMLKGSLYHYIGSKEDLLFDIVSEVHARLRAAAEQRTSKPADVIDRLTAVITAHAAYVEDNHAKAGVCAREYRALSAERRQDLLQDSVAYEQIFLTLVEEGQREGAIRTDLEASVVVKGLLGMLNLLPDWYQPTGELSAAQIGEQMATMALDGIRAPGSTAPGGPTTPTS